MSTLKRAIEIAVAAHKDQVDKTGSPYVEHLFRVMNVGKTLIDHNQKHSTIIGWLYATSKFIRI